MDLMTRRSALALGAAGTAGSFLADFSKAQAATTPSGFYFIHLFTGPDGRTHLEEIDPRQAEQKLPYWYKAKATAVAVLTYPAGHQFDWHLTRDVPRLIIQLRGLSVTIVDDGNEPGVSYHPLRPGSVMLAEDKSGKGHRGMIFSDEDAYSMQVDLAV
jgi:hypothetical protein